VTFDLLCPAWQSVQIVDRTAAPWPAHRFAHIPRCRAAPSPRRRTVPATPTWRCPAPFSNPGAASVVYTQHLPQTRISQWLHHIHPIHCHHTVPTHPGNHPICLVQLKDCEGRRDYLGFAIWIWTVVAQLVRNYVAFSAWCVSVRPGGHAKPFGRREISRPKRCHAAYPVPMQLIGDRMQAMVVLRELTREGWQRRDRLARPDMRMTYVRTPVLRIRFRGIHIQSRRRGARLPFVVSARREERPVTCLGGSGPRPNLIRDHLGRRPVSPPIVRCHRIRLVLARRRSRLDLALIFPASAARSHQCRAASRSGGLINSR
jgi:hypothetical protein